MKKWIFLAALVLVSSGSFAVDNSKKLYKVGLGCLTDCFNFVAPVINGASTVDPAETGQIIFDLSTETFKGADSNGDFHDLQTRVVNPKPAAGTVGTGTVVYDESDSEFYGKSHTGSWKKLKSQEEGVASFVSTTSGTETPNSNATWVKMNVNGSVTLTPGSWRVSGSGDFFNNGSDPAYDFIRLGWALTNGNDNATDPQFVTPEAGSVHMQEPHNPKIGGTRMNATTIRVTVSSNTDLFLVPWVRGTTISNARITTHIYAEKL